MSVEAPPQCPLYLSPEFENYAERCQARSPLTYALTVIIQRIKRHPELKSTIEAIAGKIGKPIDLTQPLTR